MPKHDNDTGHRADTAIPALLALYTGLLILALSMVGSGMPPTATFLATRILGPMTALTLIAAPACLLICTFITILRDLFQAYRIELPMKKRKNLDRWLTALKYKYIYKFIVTSSSSCEIYNAGDDGTGVESNDYGRVNFTKADLAKYLRGHRRAPENLPEDLKQAVLESIMNEWREDSNRA